MPDPERTFSGTTQSTGDHPFKVDLTVTGGSVTKDQLPDIQSRVIDLLRYMIAPDLPATQIHAEFSKQEHQRGGIGTS